ncbi:MAG: hypothetical protein JWP11_1453 [Frankiales bacterium]|nr:hypothetical protein [Frankiales bacterium]
MTAVTTTAVVRAHAPRPAALGAFGLGAASGLVIPNGPPGVGLVLLGLIGAAVLWRLSPVPVRGWRAVHAVLALLLLTATAVRAADWVVALDLAMALGLGSLALTSAAGWAGVLRGLVEVGVALPRGAAWLMRSLRTVRLMHAEAGPWLRGGALTALLLAVFVPLLASADAAFSRLVGVLLPSVPDLGLLPARVIVAGIASTGVATGMLVLLAPRAAPSFPAPGRRLVRRSEWLLPLAALDAVLATFLAVQATVLFGGDRHVLDAAGVTYASYAREGFGQLVAVTTLVLVVVAAAVRWAPRSARPALAVLCALALVVDASALMRLRLYADAYGLTRLRITATSFAGWLGMVLVVVLVAGLRPGRWVPHTVVATAALVLLGLTAANPDALIARSAVKRGADADVAYLSGLSADAVGELDRLPEPARSCALRPSVRPHSWTSANLGRARAAVVLRAHPITGECRAVR